MTPTDREHYRENGYVVLRGVVLHLGDHRIPRRKEVEDVAVERGRDEVHGAIL